MRENAIRFLSLLLCAALLISPMAGMAVSAAETENHATVTEADAEQDPSKAANPGESGTPEEPAAPEDSTAAEDSPKETPAEETWNEKDAEVYSGEDAAAEQIPMDAAPDENTTEAESNSISVGETKKFNLMSGEETLLFSPEESGTYAFFAQTGTVEGENYLKVYEGDTCLSSFV